jgi:hydrogenase nickel incorporation protein HypA/HybF
MHEVGIMESALALVAEQVCERRASRVERVVLRIGALAGVELDALRFAFDVVSRGTVAAGATLDIEAVPAASYCPACCREFEIASGFIFVCPFCRELCGEVRRGRELELSRIELS